MVDSYNLLNKSLYKLVDFECEVMKDKFSHEFIKESINYIGNTPDKVYFVCRIMNTIQSKNLIEI